MTELDPLLFPVRALVNNIRTLNIIVVGRLMRTPGMHVCNRVCMAWHGITFLFYFSQMKSSLQVTESMEPTRIL